MINHRIIAKHRRMITGMNFTWQRALKRNSEITCESQCHVFFYQSMVTSTVPQKQCKSI